MTSTFAVSGPAPMHASVDLRNESALGTLAMSVVQDLRDQLATIHGGANAETLAGACFFAQPAGLAWKPP